MFLQLCLYIQNQSLFQAEHFRPKSCYQIQTRCSTSLLHLNVHISDKSAEYQER